MKKKTERKEIKNLERRKKEKSRENEKKKRN
jgi:hypothetical protein